VAGSEDPGEDAVYVAVEGYLLRFEAGYRKGTKVPFFVRGIWEREWIVEGYKDLWE
jgi:hypothetical protein